jgi:hypothetical protein
MKKAYILSILSISLLVSCSKKEENNNNLLAALALANASSTTAAAAASAKGLTVGGKVAVAAKGAAGSVATSIQAGAVARLMSHPEIQSKMAYLQKKNKNFSLKNFSGSIPTALSKTSGTCTQTSCAAELSGSTDCVIDSAKIGSLKTTKLTVNNSYSMSALPFVQKNSLKGTIEMTKCGSRSTDYANFPNMVSTVTTGIVDTDFEETATLVSLTSSADFTTTDSNIKYVQKSTIKSANLQVGTETGIAVDLTTDISVEVVSKMTNMKTTSSATSYAYSADYTDTIKGPITTKGTVAGGVFSQTKTWAGETVTYSVSCEMNTETGAGDCKVTQK